MPRARTLPLAGNAGVGTALIAGMTLVALYLGQAIFVPFALAVLLAFVTAPVVDWLRALRVPRVLAVAITVTAAFVVVGALAALVGSQLVLLAENLPDYQGTMQHKIRELRASFSGDGVLDRLFAMFATLREEVAPAEPVALGGATQPPPLQVQQAPEGPLEVIGEVLAPLVGPVGTAGLVVVFLVFILLERHDLRDRVIRLAGGGVLRTTEALNEAAQRVSRYLVMHLIVNVTYGVPLAIGLYFIGVPNALLWGLLATLLRFLPYLGPFIAALFPLALAFAVDPGWSMLAWSAAFIITLELLSNNIVEPWLYGSSTGLSPVAVLLGAIFWTLLWGPVGLLLATPLTVCLVVMGRHVPRLEFLEVLFGSESALSPDEQLYQRLLAGQEEEAIELAETHVGEGSLVRFYETVGLAALRLAERDRREGLSAEDLERVAAGFASLVRELDEEEREPAASTPVLCIAGRRGLGNAAAMMLAHALRTKGIGARCVPAAEVAPEAIHRLELAGVELVCLTYLDAAPEANARFVARRLRRRKPGLRIVVGSLSPGFGADVPRERLAEEMHADAVETTFTELVHRAKQVVEEHAPAMVPAPPARDEAERLDALRASGLLEARARGRLDRVAARLAEAFEMPIALVSLVDESCQLWKGAVGLPAELERLRRSPRETSVCGHVVAGEAPVVVEDIARDPRFSGNPFLREHGIRFYAGAPLRTASGHVIGSLCVLDTKPRSISERDLKLLQALADGLMADTGEEKTLAAMPATP